MLSGVYAGMIFFKSWTFNVTTFVLVVFACFFKSILGRQGLVLLASQWMASSNMERWFFHLWLPETPVISYGAKTVQPLDMGVSFNGGTYPHFTPPIPKTSFFSRIQTQPYGPVGGKQTHHVRKLPDVTKTPRENPDLQDLVPILQRLGGPDAVLHLVKLDRASW